jgi:hypothetical protein
MKGRILIENKYGTGTGSFRSKTLIKNSPSDLKQQALTLTDPGTVQY